MIQPILIGGVGGSDFAVRHILAATPTAKQAGIENAMRLGEALQLYPGLIVVNPKMQFHLEKSVWIQQVIESLFPVGQVAQPRVKLFACSTGTIPREVRKCPKLQSEKSV
ncbi:Y-family DNA polymerase [Effusibacillus pohliae]|uniref:Y-family DNA polymerase n=1 Tax=Effusibacillus pohliae TaxID=232270 RepID=UPI00039C750E|nr:hypothetical protein [Effusibacillus pohliae]